MAQNRLKELTQLVESLTTYPFEIDKTGGNHYRIFIPVLGKGNSYFFTSSTSSDYRANKNILSDIRKAFRLQNIEPKPNKDKQVMTTKTDTINLFDMASKERKELFNTMPLPALKQLAHDLGEVIQNRKDDALLQAAEIIQSNGLSIDELSSLLDQPKTEPVKAIIEPKPVPKMDTQPRTRKAERIKTIRWIESVLINAPKLACKDVRTKHEQEYPLITLPVYGTFYGWYSEAKKTVTK